MGGWGWEEGGREALGYFTARAAGDELIKREDILEPFVKFETIPTLYFQPFDIILNLSNFYSTYMLALFWMLFKY